MSATRFQGLQIENGGTTSLNATSGSYRAFEIIGSRFGNTSYAQFNPTSGTATYTHINLNTGINQTGTASGRVVGIDYNPDITSITGAHYGILIRPAAFNGFGLGATLPTAIIHIAAGTTAIPQMKLETSVAPTGGALTDGTIWFDGTNLKMRIGGLTKTFTIV
jgi:hypothetical protein